MAYPGHRLAPLRARLSPAPGRVPRPARRRAHGSLCRVAWRVSFICRDRPAQAFQDLSLHVAAWPGHSGPREEPHLLGRLRPSTHRPWHGEAAEPGRPVPTDDARHGVVARQAQEVPLAEARPDERGQRSKAVARSLTKEDHMAHGAEDRLSQLWRQALQSLVGQCKSHVELSRGSEEAPEPRSGELVKLIHVDVHELSLIWRHRGALHGEPLELVEQQHAEESGIPVADRAAREVYEQDVSSIARGPDAQADTLPKNVP